ncbi:MAG: HEAT repeat domain-containing protein [Chloroflexota bacterium]
MKISKPKVTFEENLNKIKESGETVPISALYALSNMTPERQAQFQAVWSNLHPEYRRKIAAALNDLAEEVIELEFDEVFIFLLHDQEAEVRGKAIDGLWENESRQVLGELLKMLESDPSAWVREKAAIGVGRFAYLAEVGRLPQRWIDRVRDTLLAQAMSGKNPVEVERRVIEGLGYFSNNEQVTKIIERAYQSDDDLLIAGAIRAMGRNMNQRWLPEIGKEMSNSDPLIRYEAATAVGEIGSKELLMALVALFQDEDLEVRLAAVWALGQLGGPEASSQLKELLHDERESMREAAQEALKELAYADSPLIPLSGEI